MDGFIGFLCDSMCRYIGQTVTIFTTSGGLSGSGFTGVLISADPNVVRLLCDIGEPPACAVGSCCDSSFGPWGNMNNNCCGNFGGGCCNNPLGAVAVIPTIHIAAFTHNAIG